MIKLKDGYAKLIGTTATGSANNVLLSNGGDKIVGNASGNIPLNNGSLNVNLNAEKINGYTSSLLWRSNGATWNPTANITMTPTANDLEWSFDFRNKSGFTGSYWNVWDESKKTLLRVEADSGKVKAPYGFVGNLEGVATTANTANKLSVSAGSLTEPVYFNDGVPVKCTYINAKRKYEVDLSTLSNTNFYPVIFDKSDLETDCEIHSPNLTGTAPYNLNSIHFLYQSLGWTDTPKRFLVLHYGTYSNTEITIGAIGGGTNEGEQCVWLRGGLLYRFYSNKEPLLKTSNFSSGDQLFTVGTNYYGGENLKVTIVWKALETKQWVATLDYADNIYVALNVSTNGNYPLVWSVENNTESKRSLLLRKSYLDLLYNPATKQITSNGSLSIPTISNNGGVLTLKTTTENHIYLRYNNDDNNSIVLTSGHLGPTYASRGKLTLGTLGNNWKGVYSLLGYFTGDVFICNPDGGNSPRLIFQRGTTTDGAYDWDLINEAGTLKIRSNTNTGTFSSALELSRLNLTLTSNFNVLSLGYISSFKELDANDKHFNYALAYKEIADFNTVGMVVITLPNSWNNGMNLYEIDIYDYVAGGKVDDALHSKLTIGTYNYNYTDPRYYNHGYTQLGSFNRKVRLAHDGTHCCILLGEPTSTWNYTLIFLSRVLAGHSEHRTWSSGYEINLVTSEAAYTKITELYRTRLRFSDVVADNFRGNLIGNADTASSAAKWTAARTLTVGNSAKTVDGSADVTWDLKSILLNPTTITTATSWDITTPGVYKVSSGSDFTGTNNPESANGGGTPYRYGLLIVSSFGANCGLAQFYISHYDSGDSRYGIKYRTGYNTTYLTKWARILDSTNYNKYAPTLTGTGASGTWNINITGNAATATNATNSDKLDGWHRYQVLSITNRSLLEICDTLPLLECNIPIGENTSVVKTSDNTAPHAKVWYCTGYTEMQIPGTLYFTPGEVICVESWIMRPSGATGTAGTYYFGINFRDKNGKPVNSNNGCHYFGQSTNWHCPCDGVWYRRYNEFTIPTSHTAYNGSDGEGYFSGTIRGYINYNQGTIPTYYGGFRIYKKNLNVSVPSADAATKVWVDLHNSNDVEYPLIWSNSPDTENRQSRQLYKSYADLVYNPKYKRLTVKGLVTSPQFYHSLTSASSNPIFYVKAANNDSTLLRVDYSGKSTFLGDYGYSLKYLGSDSNNRLALMADNGTATTLNVAIAFTNAGNVGIRDYAKTDCALYVKGNSRFGGDSRIDGNLLVGNNATRNYIAFYGTTGDGPGSFNYTYIGENATGTNELSELILFKGNDPYNNGAGPDRIRHIAALHLFLIYKSSALSGTFEAICTSTTPVNVFAINANDITSYLSVLPSANNTYNLGSSSLKWSNVYSVLGNFSGLITSSVANGTAPFVITSKTVVGNLNSDLFDGFHETSFFRSCRGNISTDYVDIDVFSNGDSRFKVVDPGTYSINRSTHSELFINFKGDGSTSGLEFKTNYDNNARLCIRKTVDSKRISGVWKELAFYDDIKTKLDGYYWANIKISSTSSKYTLPTFLNLFIDTYDATLKIYSGRITDAKSDGNICFLTCFDNLDGQSHSYASSTYASRLNLVLLPRAGQVYIGVNPETGNTNYKLYVNGAIYGTRFAGPADKLTTARTIALGEAVQSTATAFDGSANISIPVTKLKESYLVWGDKNIVNDLGVIDNCFSDFSSNKLSFMNPDLISVEYSNDGGSTWKDYGATAEQKTAHVTSTLSHSFYLGNNKAQTTLDRLRITITAASGNLYFAVRKLMVYFCMNGATGNTVLVETSKCGSDTTFTTLGTYEVSGWTGWNSIPVSFSFGGSDNQTGNIRRIRFTYQFTGHSSGYESKTAAFVQKTYMFGGAPWSSPHSLSSTGHLYSFDVNLRAVFPKLVEAVSGFKKTGSNDNYILLGGGGHKAISGFYWADIPITTSATTNKKPTLSGIIFSGGSESFDSWGNFKFGASSSSWNVFKNDGTTSLMRISASSGNMTVLGTVTAPTFIGNLNGDITKKTPLLCAATESDNINIVENSNGAITNNYISNMSAIRKAIQFRWYSTYWQIGNIRGGASGTDGFGVTYGSNKLCFRVTEAASYVYGNMYAVHFYESSDKRLKTNIQEILNSDKMPIIKEFDWKEDGSHSYGLIAQELEEQGYSELVSVKDDGYKTVNYSAALSLIVGKLQTKIKELEKEIENLKNKN